MGGLLLKRVAPSVLTALNLLLGMASLLFCLDGAPTVAAALVLAGMVCDGLDGRLARRLGTESAFGREFDALSDVLTFGAAPVVIMYDVVLRQDGAIGVALALLFPLCGALRLARFNSGKATGGRSFVGLPITAAGGILALFTLYRGLVPTVWLPVATAALALLMISRTRYPNFSKTAMPRAAIAVIPVLAIALGVVFFAARDWIPNILLCLIVLYATSGVWLMARKPVRRVARRAQLLVRRGEP